LARPLLPPLKDDHGEFEALSAQTAHHPGGGAGVRQRAAHAPGDDDLADAFRLPKAPPDLVGAGGAGQLDEQKVGTPALGDAGARGALDRGLLRAPDRRFAGPIGRRAGRDRLAGLDDHRHEPYPLLSRPGPYGAHAPPKHEIS
jgi:hypothetical protein